MRRKRPTLNDLNTLGVTFYRAGAYELAIAQLEQAVRLAPEAAVVRANLGAAYYGSGRFAEAEREFRRSLELAPSRAAVRRLHGLSLARLNRLFEAVEEFRWTVEHSPDTWEGRSAREEIWALRGRTGPGGEETRARGERGAAAGA